MKPDKRVATISMSGKSMFPLFGRNDEVPIHWNQSPQPLSKYAFGSVVLTRQNEEWVVHRLVKGPDGLTTKGDWSGSFDEPAMVWGEVPAHRQTDLREFKNHSVSSLDRFIARLSQQVPTKSKTGRIFLKSGIFIFGSFSRLLRVMR